MKGVPEPWMSILQSAGLGGLVCGGVVAARYYMQQSRNRVVDLGVPARALMKDRELSLLVHKFTPLRHMSERTRGLYDTMIQSCNRVVDAEARKVTGGETFKASRSALQTVASAKALCHEAAKLTQKGVKCEADPYEAMRDIETLEASINNYLHNILLH